MSSSVGRNSLIMASGTAASRVTGQVRTILLAWALGTTGYAANAYQAGSMIPQVIYTLVSGGIFNAVLVPQIVRTLKAKDAETKLNKLITLAITMLLGVTLLMAIATPLLTRLYVNGSPETMALATSFTLWCMPQIFFYGLYTVVGQILAAKDHFVTYAWSSVGANVISCIGFGTFIALFGRATERPLEFWTPTKIALTAGAWTLGVAFQALVLFIPLTKIGLRYRPKFGIHGIGLRSMGPVAIWSVGIVIVDQIGNILITRVATSAPLTAQLKLHINPLDVAGNATYQNAYTIYMLPYSLIAVSVATAIFPKISRAIAERNLAEARNDLSQSLRVMGLIMCFFGAAFVVLPLPIILSLLPSVTVREALLMCGPLVALGFGIPFASSYLIIQRTFYSFEDGRNPFLFTVMSIGTQVIVLLVGEAVLPPTDWVTLIGVSGTLSFMLPFPILFVMLRKRFNGNVDGRRIFLSYAKSIIAEIAAIAVGLFCRDGVYRLVGARIGRDDGAMNWGQAVLSAMILAIIIAIVYLACLWALRSEELASMKTIIVSHIHGLAGRSGKPTSPNGKLGRSDAENGEQEQNHK
ncbi:murein biosynthesis integral membrane protein MurJ [Bifidobacterium ruminantium]|uniref:murein biosynthesis integral membrane protein MurJ n=1 Tax=Bifidobacterium ruminantium TaxID=78346 RepID=UPI001C24FD5D|nr:murein biosynthesis integral membrane protein MurJ [Bifidobacterium ruminantium]MBU9112602.1 murein biosynthesis integral membrane protein MurJ [Bifidobacterium ruminantium]